MVGVLTTVVLALAAQPSTACATARAEYEALDLERSIQTAHGVLSEDSSRPLECLEVVALASMVLGRREEARGVLTEIFERDPGRRIQDASLAPSMREFIERIRAMLVPLDARVFARWIVHDSLRLDFALDGGLRGAHAVRYSATFDPDGGSTSGGVDLEGRAATATVTVSRVDVRTVRIVGRVVDALDREVHRFSSEILLPERPPPSDVVVKVESEPVSWVVWALVGAAVVGSGIAVAAVAQPDLPEGVGIGRAEARR